MAVSVREGSISSSTLLKRLRSGSRKNATYAALTKHINRFGEYSTHKLGIQPDAYDPKLDVDFTPPREQDLTAVGLGHAA
ncbi:hypothetical protein ACH4PX_07730 [Streptomyces anulatus]